MAFLCPARIRSRVRKKTRGRKDPQPPLPLPGRITGSASIDTLVRVGLEKEEGGDRQRMTILHDFVPCVEDELSVKRGETVALLYQENDWVYVIAEADGREGFIPFVYCVPMGNSIDDLHASRKRLINNNLPNFNSQQPDDGRQLSDLLEEDEISSVVASTTTLNRHKSRSLPSIHDPTTTGATTTTGSGHGGGRHHDLSASGSGPYEDADSADVSSQAPLLGLPETTRNNNSTRTEKENTKHRTKNNNNHAVARISQNPPVSGSSNWPRYENLIDLQQNDKPAMRDEGHVNSVATIEVVDVRAFDKADSGKYVVLFRFHAVEEGDVSVDRGDFVTVLNKDDPDWFWIRKADRTEGFVPGNFVCPAEHADATAKLEQQTATSTGSSAASICSSSQPSAILTAPVTGNTLSNNCQPQQRHHPATTELIVLYDYTAQAPDDISVMRGEWVYADLSDQPEKDWLWVYAQATGKFGFIPKEFAKPPGIVRNTTTRRSNVEKHLVRSTAGRGGRGALKRTMSLSERRNQVFDPYLSP